MNAIRRPITDFVANESLEEVKGREAGSVEGSYEFVGMHKSGRKLVIEATAKNLTLDGRPARFVALRDITERRRLEQRVRQIQRMEALGELAGGVAHDFNNSLTVISGFTELLLAELDTLDPRAADLREVRKATDSAASLTRQLLAFSRQQVIQPRLVALETAVQRAIPLLRRVIGEDLAIVTSLAEQTTVVLIDPGQLEQVLMNLCINARDAMPVGGTLTVETARATFSEEELEDHWPMPVGSYGMLAISDTGVGMDATTRARIFEPFFTTKEVGKGTGLGLATVHGIVTQNAGFIWVSSAPGKGSSFKAYFPLRHALPEMPAAPMPLRVPTGTETILLVEDSQSVRAAAQAALKHFGYTVIAFPNANAALPLFDQSDSRIDLLITNVVMPENERPRSRCLRVGAAAASQGALHLGLYRREWSSGTAFPLARHRIFRSHSARSSWRGGCASCSTRANRAICALMLEGQFRWTLPGGDSFRIAQNAPTCFTASMNSLNFSGFTT